LLKSAGGWKQAATEMRAWWAANKADHFEGLFDEKLEGLLDHLFLDQLRKTAKNRVDPKYNGEVGETVKFKPHPSLRGHLYEAMGQIWHDASKGRVLLCAQVSDELLRGVVSVPLARVPK
jgi:hypothetical protein